MGSSARCKDSLEIKLMSSKTRKLLEPAVLNSQNPRIDIEVRDELAAYTTGDLIEGFVSITTRENNFGGKPMIKFQGESRTKVERTFTYGCMRANHIFLETDQTLIRDHTYQSTLHNGFIHRYPFCFVVPGQLLPQACRHRKTDIAVETSHAMLPPTLGDPRLIGRCGWPKDDLASDMARIRYFLRVDVLKPSCDTCTNEIWSSKAKAVRVIPKYHEVPPTELFESSWHCAHKERRLSQGLLNSRSGKLTAAMLQPRPIHLHGTGGKEYGCSSTAAIVNLSFVTAENASPPELQEIRSELHACTFYGIAPWTKFPTLSDQNYLHYDGGRLFCRSSSPVNISVASVHWSRASKIIAEPKLHTSNDGYEICSSNLGNLTEYTASILVPVTPSKSISFVPTFHSCLISRVYSLQLQLFYRQSRDSLFSSTLSLSMPIQITA